MLITDYEISERSQQSAFLKWTALNADDVSWVFVNGIKIYGPIYYGTLERSAYIKFSEALNKCIEIHEFSSNIGQPSNVCVRENSRPSIEWNRRADSTAVRYRIFHQDADLVDPEEQIFEQDVTDDRIKYNVKCPIRLDEGWHLFRVESVDQFGNESTHSIWPYLVFRIPDPVNGLTVADGSAGGLFDITIS